jgi:hypothetical protein
MGRSLELEKVRVYGNFPISHMLILKKKRKAQLGFLFSVGLVIIAVTAVRLPRTLQHATSETTRITWTTGEFLAATFVANAPTLYSFRQRFQQRKSRARQSSQFSHSSPRVRSDLGGTTLTGFFDESSSPRISNDVEAGAAPQSSEGGKPENKEGKHSVGKMLFTSSTNKSNG